MFFNKKKSELLTHEHINFGFGVTPSLAAENPLFSQCDCHQMPVLNRFIRENPPILKPS